MTQQKGDFILIDYTAKVKETNEVFDTTNEEISKKERLHKEGEIYEPKLVVIGENWVLKALDESLTTMELGKTQTVEIPPKQLTAKGTNPTIGMRIDYNGKTATIRSIGAGRVLLDFNPPLAGKTLVYDVTVNKKLETNEEKITALIHRRIPLAEPETFRFAIKGKTTLTIDMPETAFYIEGIQIAKRGIAMDVQRFLPELTEIRFVETFKSEPKPEIKPKPEPEPKPEAPTEEPKPKPKPKKKPTTKQKPEKSKPKQEPKPETES
jgi:peptidylprolyl isomerase